MPLEDTTDAYFKATYEITGPAADARARAVEICVEQTVEFPLDLVPNQTIRDDIVGRVANVDEVANGCRVEIHFPVETAGGELPQLLNVLFGNTSIKPGIRLVRFDLPEVMTRAYTGPRFGRTGLRRLLDAPQRPLLCTAVKPMGLCASDLADLAYAFARGGIDLVKDDHGLANQSFCSFDERVSRCADAVARANAETGNRCLYVANVTAPFSEIRERAERAAAAGAGGMLVAPGLVGFDAMRTLAEVGPDLPILFHPALLGSYTVTPDAGMSHGVLYGQLCRLAGGDASIFPHCGGRFAFSEVDCRDLVDGTQRPMGSIAPSFPVPAGGMRLDRVPSLLQFYGRDVMLLIGGDLHRHGELTATCARFREMVEKWSE